MTMGAADIHSIALYIPLARPRPGFWRWHMHDPEKVETGFFEKIMRQKWIWKND
jgi:hypothetical protein